MLLNISKLAKQRLLRGHIVVGISCSLLLYLSVFFGLFAIFLPYIEVWEKPSRYFETAEITSFDYEPMIDAVLADPAFPRDRVIVHLPGYKSDPALVVTHQFTDETAFHPASGKQLDDEGDASHLADFLNGMHYGKPLRMSAYFIFGLMAVAASFVTVGGLLLLLIMKFRGPEHNQQNVFSYWHRQLLLWTSPVFLIIVLGSAGICLGSSSTGPMASVVTDGKYTNVRPLVGPVMFPETPRIEPANKKAEMIPIKELILSAKKLKPNIVFEKLTLTNWGDETATIKIEGYEPHKPFLNGVLSKPSVTMNAVDGQIIDQLSVFERSWAVMFADFLVSVHFLFSINIFLRTVVFFLMLASCFSLAFGVMLWLEKKARRFREKVPFYHWMGKMSLWVMVGVIPATGFIFVLQWVLPFDMEDRVLWQQGLFFCAWMATLFWSFFRINSYTAAREFLRAGGILFLCSVLLHSFQPGSDPLTLAQSGLYHIAAVDIGLALLGAVFLLAAWKLPKDRSEAEQFWIINRKKEKA